MQVVVGGVEEKAGFGRRRRKVVSSGKLKARGKAREKCMDKWKGMGQGECVQQVVEMGR